MNLKRKYLRVLFAVALATFLALSTNSLGADPECNKECREEHRECISICNKHVKDPSALKKCKDEGCKQALDDCFKDCQEDS